MKKLIIFFILSPYRAKNYDFDNLLKPKNAELLVLSDDYTIKTYIDNKNLSAVILPMVDFKNYGFKYLSLEAIQNVIEEYQRNENYEIRLYSEEELFLDDVADLNEKYNLKGIQKKELNKFRNKYYMKESLRKEPIHFKVPKYTRDYLDALKFKFPVIIKPLSLAGSIGVEKINNKEDLLTYINSRKMDGYIIEEFIEGDLFHCDALVYQGDLKIFLCGKYFDPLEYATKNKTYIGSEIINEGKIYQDLYDATVEIIDSLNVESSMVHIEIILHAGKLFFVEIGLRPAGAWVPKMYSLAYGINIYNYHLYTSYPTDDFESLFQKPTYINNFCCGIYLMRLNDKIIKDIYIPKLDCEFLYNPFLSAWKVTKKSSSVMDSVAEIYFYSNSRDQYLSSINKFIDDHKIIS